jgi:hypothetical protein
MRNGGSPSSITHDTCTRELTITLRNGIPNGVIRGGAFSFFIFYFFKLNSNHFCPIDRKWKRKTQKFEKEREIQK